MAGQKIHDQNTWVGHVKGANLPLGTKEKHYSSAEGIGELDKYEDTTEAIKSQQEENKRKVKGHPMRPGYRQ